MGKVFGAFAKRKGVESKAMRFIYDGRRVGDDDTPASVSDNLRFLKRLFCQRRHIRFQNLAIREFRSPQHVHS